MANKLKKMQMHKLFTLCNLLLENLDELQVTSVKVLKFKDDLTSFCELLNDEVKDTETIQKGTYFQDLANRIDTVIRKNFNENM